MVQGILDNMRVFPGPYITKSGVGLQLSVVWDTEWKDLVIKTNLRLWSGGINTGDVGILNEFLGNRDGGFG